MQKRKVSISRNFKGDIKELISKTTPHTYACLQAIVTALRGPDMIFDSFSNRTSLKWYTTARLRAIVTPNFDGDVNRLSLDLAQRRERDLLLGKCNGHFSVHWREAVNAVRVIYNYDLDEEKDVEHEDI